MSRLPIVSTQICENLPWEHLLAYIEAILRAYKGYGRRYNKYKAGIKILVKAYGMKTIAAEVEEEWRHLYRRR